MRSLLLDAENATLNFDEWHKGLDPEYRDAIGYQLGLSQDTEAEKRRIASSLWLSAQTGLRVADIESNYEEVKARYAAERELPADQWKDEATFQSTVRTQADDFRSQRKLAEDLARQARRVALWVPALPVESRPILEDWKRAKKTDKGYRADKDGLYTASFTEQVRRERERLDPVLEIVNEAWNLLADKDGLFASAQSAAERKAEADRLGPLLPGTDLPETALPQETPNRSDTLFRLAQRIAREPRAAQDTIIGALRDRAEMLPPAEKDSYVARWQEALGRGGDLIRRETLYRGPGRLLGGISENVERGLNSLGIVPGVAKGVGDWGREHLRVAQVMGRLAKLSEEKILPNEGDNLLERIGLGVAQSAATFATAAGATPFALYPMLEGQAYDELEEDFARDGMSGDQADRAARQISPFAGAAMVALERLTFGYSRGPTAALQRKLIQNIAKSRPVTAFAAGLTLETGEQFLQEVAQDTMPAFMADLAGMLGVAVPDQQVLDRLVQAASPETLGVSIVFALGGGGSMPGVEQTRALQALGFTPEATDAVLAAQTDTARQQAFMEGILTANPGEGGTVLEAEGATAAIDEAEANAGAGVVRTTRDKDGWWLEHRDGSRTRADSQEQLIKLREDIWETNDEATAEQYVRIYDWMSADTKTVSFADVGASLVDDGGAFFQRPGEARIDREMTPQAAQELQAELERLRATSNDPTLVAAMLGENVVRWKERIGEDAVAIVEAVTIGTYRGKNITTPLHERFESRLNELILTGRLRWAEVVEAIRTLELATGKRYLANDQNETDVRETFMELMVADTVGRRKDGRRHRAGSLAREVRDATRRNPEQRHVLGKLGDFLRAVRAHVQAITQTAATIIRARRAGKLTDTDAFTSLADRILALDSQYQFEDQVLTTAEDLARAGVTAPVDVDLPDSQNQDLGGFSLGNVHPSLKAKLPGLKGAAFEKLPRVPDEPKAGNVQKTMESIDTIVAAIGNPLESMQKWGTFVRAIMGQKLGGKITDFLVAPERAMMYTKGEGFEFVTDAMLKHPEYVAAREQGLADGAQMLANFRAGKLKRADLAGLFAWGLMSRGVGAYIQEGAYLSLHREGLLQKLEDAFSGKIDPESINGWAKKVIKQGPGVSASQNAMILGEQVKALMSDVEGRLAIDVIYDAWRSNMTGPELRRFVRSIFHADRPSLQIQNKVLSFMILVSGRPDVLVLDRIQFRHLWGGTAIDKSLDDLAKKVQKAKKATIKRYGKKSEQARLAEETSDDPTNIYDALPRFDKDGSFKFAKRKGKLKIATQGIAGAGDGVQGMALYEVLERGLTEKVRAAYEAAGISYPGVGAFHWDSWLVTSQQAISHPTLKVVSGKDLSPTVGVQQGKFTQIDYGMVFRLDGNYARELLTEPGTWVIIPKPHLKKYSKKSVDRAIGRTIPLEKDETGKDRDRPWVEGLSQEERARFDRFIETLGGRVTPTGEAGVDTGTDDGGSQPRPGDNATTGFSLVPVLDRIEEAGGRLLAAGRIGEDQGGSGADVRGRVGVISAEDFSRIAGTNKRSHKFGTSVDVYDPASYEGYDLLVVERDGETATASISPSGEIGAVTKSPGGGPDMVAQVFDAAVSTGRVKWLNGFDTVLPRIYSDLGFKAEARLPFNDEYAPDGWDFDVYKKFNAGRPDVVFMRYIGEPQTYQDGDGNYVEDYDAGVVSVTSFSLQVTAKQDAAYAAAEKAGDEKTGAAMLGEVIKASGLPILDDSASEAYRVRRTAPPKKTVKAYKLFATNPKSPGKLFPLFVGANESIPQGVWLDAIAGKDAALSKTGKRKVQSKLGPLAYRPGWHAGDLPYASHIGVKDSDGKVYARRGNEVWAEVEMAADVDYQGQANASPTKDIREMPVDGSYRFKTNPNMTGQWVISGAMKVTRVMSQQEVDAALKKSGVNPMPWVGGPLVLERLGLTNETAASRAKLADTFTYDETGKLIPLSKRMNPNDERAGFSLTSRLDAVADALNNRRNFRSPKEVHKFFEAAREEVVGMARAMRHNDSLGSKGPWLEMAQGREIMDLRRRHRDALDAFDEGVVMSAEEHEAKVEKLKQAHEFDMEAAKADGWSSDRRDALRQRQRVEMEKLKAQGTAARLRTAASIAKERAALVLSQSKETAAMQSKHRAEGVRQKGKLTDAERRKEMLRALSILDAILMQFPPVVRAKVGGFVKLASLTTTDAREEFLLDRVDKVDRVLEEWLSDNYDAQMRRILKLARAKGDAGEKMKGFDADTHKVFKSVEAAMDEARVDVDARLLAIDARINSGLLTLEEEDLARLEHALVNLAGEWNQADAARRAAAVAAANDFYTDGRMRFKARMAVIKARRYAMSQSLMLGTGRAGTRGERKAMMRRDESRSGFVKGILQSLSGWEQVLHRAFGEGEVVDELVDRERAAAYQWEDRMQALSDDVQGLFTKLAGSPLDGEKLRYRMSTDTIDMGDGWGQFSELEAMQAMLMWRQPDGKRHMEGHHIDQKWVEKMKKGLTPEGEKVMEFISDRYAEEYEILNPIYREAFGVDLPYNALYAPLTVNPQQANKNQITDPATGFAVNGSGTTPPALRTRSASAIAEPQFRDALQVLMSHRRQIEHWMAYQELARDMTYVLGNRNLLNSVEARAGLQISEQLPRWVAMFAEGGIRDAAANDRLNQFLKRFRGRFSRMALVGRAGVLAIQSTQLAAAAAEIPADAYVQRFSKLMTGNLAWGDALRSSFIQRRIKQMPPIVAQAMEGLQSADPNVVKHTIQRIGELISGADGLFTAGTYAIILDYQRTLLREQGVPDPDIDALAHKAAERITERVAQPTRMATRSYFENSLTSPLARMVWDFASEPRQKIVLAAWAIASKDKARAARAIFVTWVIGGLGAGIIRNIWRDARDDEDEEWFDEKHWGTRRLIAQTLGGPLNGVPLWGDAVEGMLGKLTGQPAFATDPLGLEQAYSAGKRMVTGKTWEDDEDVENTLRDVEAIMRLIGSFSETAASATSGMHILRDAASLVDNLVESLRRDEEPDPPSQ